MKRYILFFFLILAVSINASSQEAQSDVRTNETKIADLLMQLPAQGSSELEHIMIDLFQFGGRMITDFATQLVPPGKGDDSRLRYAISGMTKYASSGNNEKYRAACSEALCEALALTEYDEVKDFLLQELQYVAGEEAVPYVAPFLTDQRLSDPAVRVMVRINTETSKSALLTYLTKAGTKQKVHIVQGLGETQYIPAVKELRELATGNVAMLKKAALRALAEMGDPGSARLLASEARKVAYNYEASGATDNYLLFLKRTAESGDPVSSGKACAELIKSKKIPLQTRIAAIEILAGAEPGAAKPFLEKAVQSPDIVYRMSALSILNQYYGKEITSTLRNALAEASDPGVMADIIRIIGKQHDPSSFNLILPYLYSNDQELQQSSIYALALTGGTAAIEPLTKLITKTKPEVIPHIKTALLGIEGNKVTEAAAKAIPGASGEAAVALLEILADRRADQYTETVFITINNPDPAVSLSAARALTSVASLKDAEKIGRIMEQTADDTLIMVLQDALFASLHGCNKQKDKTEKVKGLMTGKAERSTYYFPVLERIGGKEALEIVEEAYFSGDQFRKEAALLSLCNWSDDSAMDLLYHIAKSGPAKDASLALSGYISKINSSANTPDQKVLMFRNAMDRASELEQQEKIIGGISSNSTLLALIFVSGYLNHPTLQQSAVHAVQRIVLKNPSLHGDEVGRIIMSAIQVNKDPEADYQKEALLKHMKGLEEGEGYVSLFNGKDLSGWQGLVENPVRRAEMTPEQLALAQEKADEIMRRDWLIKNRMLIYEGKGFENLCSQKTYRDFELIFDWKIGPGGDGGVYLRGIPQVQIWDTSRTDAGAEVGSGGLYNNQTYRSTPIEVADNPVGEWNTFRIKMVGDKVTVHLNGVLVTDNVILENYWDPNLPVFESGPIELQAHNSRIEYRDIYIREIPSPEPYILSEKETEEGFVPLFNGLDLTGWTGNKIDYFAQEGMIVCQPTGGKGRDNLYTEKQYSDFILRFEFLLTPGANNGLGIRTPTTGDAAYVGMELQILDNSADIYKNLKPYQYHGSVYGVIPAKRGFQKPVGEWNIQEVQANGTHIRVILNGTVIVDGDIKEASNGGTETMDGRNHPGLLNESGHIGFLGHGSPLKFRNIRIKELDH